MSVKKRSFWMMILLSTITCGLYGLYWWFCYTEDSNRITEGRSHEKPSPNFILVILLSTVTCGIYYFIWLYKQGNRLADAAESYGYRTRTTGSSLLLWYIFGSALCGLGPLIALYMWIDLFNLAAEGYNNQLPGGGNPGGGNPGGSPVPEAAAPIAAVAEKMERGAGNLAGKLQSSKGFSDIKKMVGDKMPGGQRGEAAYARLITSKCCMPSNGMNIRSLNSSELWHPEAPALVTKVQIADVSQDGNVGLTVGFQNLSDKKIVGIYFDIVCYNMLKEQVGTLNDICYIDLNVGQGQIFENPVPITLPDKTIRHCVIVVRHIVYGDESIWSYEGSQAFEPVEEQGKLNLPDGLSDEFRQQMKGAAPNVRYDYMPEDRGDYWFCACGQLNPAGASSCIACKADRNQEFGLLDMGFLADARDTRMEEERIAREEAERLEAERRAREEELKAQRAAERNQKIEEAQKKAKETFIAVKNRGEEKIKGSGLLKKSGNGGGMAAAAGAAGAAMAGAAAGTCPKCGKPYRAGDKFCMGCGNKLEMPQAAFEPADSGKGMPAGILCPKCGIENDPDSRFCMGCGEPLNKETAPAQSQPSYTSQAPVQSQPVSYADQPAEQSQPASCASEPVRQPEENDPDELKTVVLTPEMAAQIAAGQQQGQGGDAPSDKEPVKDGVCPACGYVNEPGSMFCMGCGSRLD